MNKIFTIIIKHKLKWSDSRDNMFRHIANIFNGKEHKAVGDDFDCYNCRFDFPSEEDCVIFYNHLREMKFIRKPYCISSFLTK